MKVNTNNHYFWWIRRFSIIKNDNLFKLNFQVNTAKWKSQIVCIYVCGNWQADIKMYVKMQKAKKSQVYHQEKQNWKIYRPDFKTDDKTTVFEMIWYQCQGIQSTLVQLTLEKNVWMVRKREREKKKKDKMEVSTSCGKKMIF